MNGVLVTFLVIVGAGFAVLIGYAVSHRFMTGRERSSDVDVGLEGQVGLQSQAVYMAQVRDRNRQDLVGKYGSRYQMRPISQNMESAAGTSQY